MTTQTLDYYDYGPVLSHNATYNFIVGARGLGKTYGAKKQVIQDYIKRGDEFIYLRRYKTENRTRPTFFNDIAAEFPDHTFRVNGSTAQISKDGKNWDTIGYFMNLSVASAIKSASFPNVKTIIFDEFIIDKSHLMYLPKEVDAFNDFYSTVDRWQDKTKVLFLANSLSIMNPYFLEYDVKPENAKNGFIKKFGGFILAHFPDSATFAEQVKQTRFGSFISKTSPEYADYSIGNTFKDAGGQLLEKKPADANYHMTLKTRAGYFSVWLKLPMIYIQEKRPKQEIVLTNDLNLVSDTVGYAEYSSKTMQYLRTYFKAGNVRFDSDKTRNMFMEVYRR